MKNEWIPVFDAYHFCDIWSNLKVKTRITTSINTKILREKEREREREERNNNFRCPKIKGCYLTYTLLYSIISFD